MTGSCSGRLTSQVTLRLESRDMKNKDLLTFLGLSFGIGWFFMTLAVIYGS